MALPTQARGFGRRVHTSYGRVMIRFEGSNVTHVEIETRRSWEYKDLPGDSVSLSRER